MEHVLLTNVLVWAGVVALFLLCLPSVRISQVILEISARALRLALLAVLGGGICLWFLPDMAPALLREKFYRLPDVVQANLPEPGTPLFGLTLAAIVVLAFLPALAVLDVARRLAGQRLNTLCDLADAGPLPLPTNTSKHSPHRQSSHPRVPKKASTSPTPAVEALTMAQRRNPPHIAGQGNRASTPTN